jgi:hypothetical protein
MTLVPTDYQDLIGASHLYGFVIQFIDAHMGSVANPLQFHEHLAQLQSTVELHASHSFYKLVLSKKSTRFDFMTQVLGFLSGMSLIARVAYSAWLQVDAKTRGYTSWLWTNSVIRCFSAILCFFVTEEPKEDDSLEEDEEKAPPNFGDDDTVLARRHQAKTAVKPMIQQSTKGEYHEVPQSAREQNSASSGALRT